MAGSGNESSSAILTLGIESGSKRERHAHRTAADECPSRCPEMEGSARGITSASGKLERGRVSRADRSPEPVSRVHRWHAGTIAHAHGQAPGDFGVPVPRIPPFFGTSRGKGP